MGLGSQANPQKPVSSKKLNVISYTVFKREGEELVLAGGPQAPVCLSIDPALGTPLTPKETGPTSEQRD